MPTVPRWRCWSTRLRERGYLSHALNVPEAGAAWGRALPGYTFQPSASGHSLARIDAMFGRLLDRPRRRSTDSGESLVAAIGDDEQFAVATALMAQHLGFPARVVVGAAAHGWRRGRAALCGGRLPGREPHRVDRGAVGGGRVGGGRCHAAARRGADPDVARQRDPENPTEVQPEAAREVVPPDPEQQDAPKTDDPQQAGIDWAPLWAALRVVGIVVAALVLLCGPFLPSSAPRLLASSPPGCPEAASRVVGGWDEYVDTAIDHGLPAPAAHTRSELAAVYATPDAPTLALVADRAVFSVRRSRPRRRRSSGGSWTMSAGDSTKRRQ